MSKLLYDELYELTINFNRHQFINLLMEKDRKIQDLSTDKQQLNMLVNSCQNEIRRLKEQTNQENVQQYISAKKSPVHSCIELSKYFIGKHTTLPVYLTSQFENEFNSKMYLLEITQQKNQQLKEQQKEFIEWLEKMAYQDIISSDFTNGCKVAYGCILKKYKEIIGSDK